MGILQREVLCMPIDALISHPFLSAELQGTLPAPILGAVLPVPNAPAAPAGLPVPPVATAIASSTAQQVAGVVHQLINQVMQAMECWMMEMCGLSTPYRHLYNINIYIYPHKKIHIYIYIIHIYLSIYIYIYIHLKSMYCDMMCPKKVRHSKVWSDW